MNVLFVCSRNQWRSPTAERIFSRHYGINTRSAGTSRQARHALSSADLAWATLIFVMEEKHKQWIKQNFRADLHAQEIIVLDIPDDYQYMSPELVEILQQVVPPYLP